MNEQENMKLLVPKKTHFKKIFYFNSGQKREFHHFKYQLLQLKKEILKNGQIVVFLCIGSDRATGDCFGPLIGNALSEKIKKNNRSSTVPTIYGTIEKPIHAVNLEKNILRIYDTIKNPYIIAIDASLGVMEHIGFITLGPGPLFPGIGVKKDLPKIGDAAITGIVNVSKAESYHTLQTTRLSTVMKLADFVSLALMETFF